MSDSLVAAIALYALALAAWAALAAARDVPVGPGGPIVLELALAGQALAAAASLLLGHHPSEPATNLGYLAASVAILPAALPALRGGTRWDSVVLAIVCVALAVVALRLRATWDA